MSVPRKYGLLRAIATMLKVLGVVALVLGLVGMILVLVNGSGGPVDSTLATLGIPAWLTTAGAIAFPVIGLIWFVQLFAFGSILSLLIEIEENTRALALPPQ
jgi:hypothetical protein